MGTGAAAAARAPAAPAPSPTLSVGGTPNPGRLPRDDRAALAGIVHVLITGCTWAQVPTEQFGCSGVTCWRRLRDWTEAGVWPRLHQVSPAGGRYPQLEELRAVGKLDLETAVVDGSHVRALKAGSHRSFTGRPLPQGVEAPPADRWRRCSAGGHSHRRQPSRRDPAAAVPRCFSRSCVVFAAVLACVRYLFADRGYDFGVYRRALRQRGVPPRAGGTPSPRIVCRGVAHGSGLGRTRWGVERSFAWG